jgi:glycosyltransferase involved in cell wall biosynthesis
VALALKEFVQLTVVSVNADQDSRSASSPLMQSVGVARHMDVRPVGRDLVGKVLRSVSARPRFAHGLRVTSDDEASLRALAKEHDVTWFFKLRTANMFSDVAWPCSIVDVDDLPSSFHESSMTHLQGVARLRARWDRWQWRRREALLGSRFDTAITCSSDDAGRMPKSLPVHVIPNGFARPATEPSRAPDQEAPRLGFVGLLEHLPNARGLEWFIEDCWPLIRKVVPAARLRLMGKGSDQFACGLGKGVEGLGWVDDAAAEMGSWSAMIVPLLAGGGTRVKIAEGFARKCPVISTTVGAYGYPVADGRELRISDSPEGFAQACIEILKSPEKGAALAERGWEAFLKNWTWDAIKPRIKGAVEGCLACK